MTQRGLGLASWVTLGPCPVVAWRVRDAQNEQAQTIGGLYHGLPINDQQGSSLADNAAKANTGRCPNRGHTDGGKVHAALLDGLGSLGQHAADLACLANAQGLGQVRTARQHGIGALLPLNR